MILIVFFFRCPQESKTSIAFKEPNVEKTSELVGGSIAGLVLVIFTMTVTIWCWKKGKCPCCKRNFTVVEENEMYGAPQNYDEYDKDDYDTKVIDDNYMYYES